MRIIAFCIAVALLAVVAAPTTAAAPVGDCDQEATVEVCAPVCIQGPCLPYVCVHRGDDICVRL